ncbi:acyl-CoA dehydrogenase family protein [Intestinimonas sp.]
MERIYRDVRVCSIYEGSYQVQQMVISGQLLK